MNQQDKDTGRQTTISRSVGDKQAGELSAQSPHAVRENIML